MKYFLRTLILVIFLICNFSFAQTSSLTHSQILMLKGVLLEELKKQDFLNFSRLTSENEIRSCEIEFQKTIVDKRGKQEEIYVVKGSLSSHYYKDKFRSVASLKVSPSKLNLENIKSLDNLDNAWIIEKPNYATILLGDKNFNVFKYSDFECETGGLCTAYADDEKLRLTQILLNPKLNTLKIVFNFEKDTYDKTIEVSKISNEYPKIKNSFMSCQLEIIEKIKTDLNNSIKSK